MRMSGHGWLLLLRWIDDDLYDRYWWVECVCLCFHPQRERERERYDEDWLKSYWNGVFVCFCREIGNNAPFFLRICHFKKLLKINKENNGEKEKTADLEKVVFQKLPFLFINKVMKMIFVNLFSFFIPFSLLNTYWSCFRSLTLTHTHTHTYENKS